jgi:hypothetical protein
VSLIPSHEKQSHDDVGELSCTVTYVMYSLLSLVKIAADFSHHLYLAVSSTRHRDINNMTRIMEAAGIIATRCGDRPSDLQIINSASSARRRAAVVCGDI